jgi:hypothetical protein
MLVFLRNKDNFSHYRNKNQWTFARNMTNMYRLLVLACLLLATTCQAKDISGDMDVEVNLHDTTMARLQQLNNRVDQIQPLETRRHPDIDLSTVSL